MQRIVEFKKRRTTITSLIGTDSEPELREEFIKEMRRIEKDKRKPIKIKNIDELLVEE